MRRLSIDRMKRLWIILAVLVIVTVLFIPATVRQDLGWIDSISGSQKRQTVWRFGAASMPVMSESLLAARFRKIGLQWEPDWENVRGTYVDIFGRNVGHEHVWPAPEIYTLAVSPGLQRSYLVASSDDDIREFFRIMSSGTEDEKKAAVEAACDRALGEYAATQPGGSFRP
jgi:hypothetical protein